MSKYDVALNLSISSLVIGCLAALVFIYYKYAGYAKKSLLNYGSKGAIAVAIILLNIAVLLNSKHKTENYLKPAIKRPINTPKRVRWADEQRHTR